MTANEEMITHTDAARELHVTPATLYRWLKLRGIATYRKVGDRKGYVRRRDLATLHDWYVKTDDDSGKQVAAA